MSATPASMLHIVSSGLQDRERLNAPSGKPSIQFYKSVMRKRTRWASHWVRVDFDNLPDFGRTATVTLPIKGELITRATLVVDLPDIYTPQQKAFTQSYNQDPDSAIVAPSWAWTNSIGHAICSSVQMLIGDAIIDQFDSRHLEVIDEHSRPVEHFDSTDLLIARDPSSFSDQQTVQFYKTTNTPQTDPQTLEIIFPFWWNRGPGPQALPIQALWKDKVQLKVSFRPMQQCVYTSTRIDPRNPPLSANQGTEPMPNIAGCGFFMKDPSGQPIYNAASTADLEAKDITDGFTGSINPTYRMPADFQLKDAYWIIEYVSLEDREASAYRLADLEIPIEQHIPMPIVTTGGSKDIRIRMGPGGLVRDLTWIAQRVEAPDYNAYFLFSRDLGPVGGSPCDFPWWPDAQIPDWDYGDGYIRPAFADRRSDPIAAAKMTIRGLTRFEHEAPSFFRSLIPALNCQRAPLIDRYIYRYDFGFWPSGGLAEALYLPRDEIRGCANWDKLPRRELALTMNQNACDEFTWTSDPSGIQINGQQFVNIDALFPGTPDGLQVTLTGAHPRLSTGAPDLLGDNGDGAVVKGVIDWTLVRRQPGYIGLFARTNTNGSASIVLQTTGGYTWVAVAAGGGQGQLQSGSGGRAGSAVEIGWQGGNVDQTHDPVDSKNGTFVYNNTSNADTTATFGGPYPNSITGATYTVVSDGVLQSVSVAFSLNAGTPTLAFSIIVDGTVYPLTTPTSNVNVPLRQYTLTSPVPIICHVSDSIVVQATITSGLNDLRMHTPIELAAKILVKQQSSVSETIFGGGGGGRLTEAGVGQNDGLIMSTDPAFVTSNQQTGGTTYTFHGGDGYYGGGSGSTLTLSGIIWLGGAVKYRGGGGGGGSYVSGLITQVETFTNTQATDVRIDLVPLTRTAVPQPSFNIYSWITRYNRLRITGGRGSLMFNETS
jgi:hypothetical protein